MSIVRSIRFGLPVAAFACVVGCGGGGGGHGAAAESLSGGWFNCPSIPTTPPSPTQGFSVAWQVSEAPDGTASGTGTVTYLAQGTEVTAPVSMTGTDTAGNVSLTAGDDSGPGADPNADCAFTGTFASSSSIVGTLSSATVGTDVPFTLYRDGSAVTCPG